MNKKMLKVPPSPRNNPEIVGPPIDYFSSSDTLKYVKEELPADSDSTDSSKTPDPSKVELLYDGYFYDVTSWIKRHPGGDVINLYTSSGEDSSVAIRQFHLRTFDRVMTIMKMLPKRPAVVEKDNLDPNIVERHRILTEDFSRLHEELKAEGLFDPDPVRYARRLAEALVIFLVGLAMSYYLSPLSIVFRILAVLVMTLAGGQALWLGHEGGHNGFTGDKKIDRIIQTFIYGCVFGLSASSWNSTHAEHHAMPQHVTKDADLKTLPILAFNKKLVDNKPSLAKSFWLRHQKWMFAACDTLIVTLTWKFNHHIKYCIEHGKIFDLICMGLHYSIVPVVGVVDWMAITWLGSVYVLGNLILSHTHLPVVEEGQQLHWVEYAFHHTTNIRSSWWVDWWTGHLNYQIEHHLFPSMPEYKNKLCRDKTRAFAEKHNLPYYLCSYWEAMKNTYNNLENVSEEIRHIM